MTCIIGFVDGDTMHMGGDSAYISGWHIRVGAPKVFRLGEMLIGVSGYPRALQIVRHHLEVPEHPDDRDAESYMVTCFVPALRQAFKEHGFAEVQHNQENYDSTLMVAYRGTLFEIESNFQLSHYREPYAAIGAGRTYALAAMNLLHQEHAPEDAIRRSLETAAHFCTGVIAPFYIETLEVNSHGS
jgi:hypothetical protein